MNNYFFLKIFFLKIFFQKINFQPTRLNLQIKFKMNKQKTIIFQILPPKLLIRCMIQNNKKNKNSMKKKFRLEYSEIAMTILNSNKKIYFLS